MLPAFPPKKLFSLTPAEVEQRREQLEKYMQAGEWLENRTLGSHHGGLWGKGANVVLVQGPEFWGHLLCDLFFSSSKGYLRMLWRLGKPLNKR